MTDDTRREALDETELEEQSGAALPDRAAMSIITPPGDSLGPPPMTDGGIVDHGPGFPPENPPEQGDGEVHILPYPYPPEQTDNVS
jgi:hypothetical protein